MYDDGENMVSIAIVDHLKKKYQRGRNGSKEEKFLGVQVITKNTMWDPDRREYANALFLHGENARMLIRMYWSYCLKMEREF